MALFASICLVVNAFYHQPLNPVVSVTEASSAGEPGTREREIALYPVTPTASPLAATAVPEATPPTQLAPKPIAPRPSVNGVSEKNCDLSLLCAANGNGTTGGTAVNREFDPAANNGRMTILLMGLDRRPGESFVSRTDTIMLLSINPANGTASLLSIPRDLYVTIPGHGRHRVNAAFVYGASGGDQAGGVALAMETIELAFGVPIDHYMVVDFHAAIKLIDALGGVDIYLPYPIDDPTFPDMNYGYAPLYIPAGQHHFDGETALKYARTRHQDNDFYRAQRQQQLLFAVRKKVLNLGLTNLITRAPSLYQQVSRSIFTDMTLEELIRLGKVVGQIPVEEIETAVLDYEYVVGHRTETGAHVLLLSAEKAALLIQRLFYDKPLMADDILP